jgi:hypothetical protein
MTMSPTPTEIAWAAGLFEGEGCIVTDKKTGYHRLILTMTDKDVVEKFAKIVGIERVVPLQRAPDPTRKPAWTWRTGKRVEVRRILATFLPYLGNRRGYKALNALDDIELA